MSMRHGTLGILGLVAMVGLSAPRAAAQCEPTWQEGFAFGDVASTVYDQLVFDDGNGPALYIAGGFASAGGTSARGVARWNGKAWSALGGGVQGRVEALAVVEEGGLPILYAGGAFSMADGNPAANIARWDGTTWTALGVGTNGTVNALATWDDGTGPALYAGGEFTQAGGIPANRLARWDGFSWSAVSTGMDAIPGPVSGAAQLQGLPGATVDVTVRQGDCQHVLSGGYHYRARR